MMTEDRASECVDYGELYGRNSVEELNPKNAGEITIPKSRKGLLDKLASGIVKNWKTRYFQLDKGTLVYYEPTQWYVKGQYNLVGLVFAHNYPADTPETIRLQVDGKPDIVLRAKDLTTRTKWRQSLAEHIRYATSIKEREFMNAQTSPGAHLSIPTPSSRPVVTRSTTVTAPPICKGWLWKKGQIMPTIKKRFFILDEGNIYYYASDISSLLEVVPDGEIGEGIRDHSCLPKPLGMMSITQYQVYTDTSQGRIELILTPGAKSNGTRKLSLFCEDYTQRDIWVRALTSHSAYDPITGSFSQMDASFSVN